MSKHMGNKCRQLTKAKGLRALSALKNLSRMICTSNNPLPLHMSSMPVMWAQRFEFVFSNMSNRG